MVLAAFVGGLMIGGTIGVLVAAFCFAAWRSDAAAVAAANAAEDRLEASIAARAAAAAAAPPPAPAPLADLPLTDMPLTALPLAAGVPGQPAAGAYVPHPGTMGRGLQEPTDQRV